MYRLTPKAECAKSLEAALRTLAANVVACPGSNGVQIYREQRQPEGALVFMEAWRTAADWEASKEHMPSGAFGALMAHVDGKPDLVELSRIVVFDPKD